MFSESAFSYLVIRENRRKNNMLMFVALFYCTISHLS